MLYLNLSPVVYITLSVVQVYVPANPGSIPVILPSSTEAQITNLHHSHAAKETLFNEYDRTDKSLLQHLIRTIEKMFVRSLQHK